MRNARKLLVTPKVVPVGTNPFNPDEVAPGNGKHQKFVSASIHARRVRKSQPLAAVYRGEKCFFYGHIASGVSRTGHPGGSEGGKVMA